MIVENITFDVQTRIRGCKAIQDESSLFHHMAENWDLEISPLSRGP